MRDSLLQMYVGDSLLIALNVDIAESKSKRLCTSILGIPVEKSCVLSQVVWIVFIRWGEAVDQVVEQ